MSNDDPSDPMSIVDPEAWLARHAELLKAIASGTPPAMDSVTVTPEEERSIQRDLARRALTTIQHIESQGGVTSDRARSWLEWRKHVERARMDGEPKPPWQPIETCHRDGLDVLLWARTLGSLTLFTAVYGRWHKGGWVENRSLHSDDDDADAPPETQPVTYLEATHWLPHLCGSIQGD